MNVASPKKAPGGGAAVPEDLVPFKLRGGTFTLLVLQLIDLKNPNFFHWLLDKINQAPNFYRHAPVVLDLQGLAEAGPFNFAELARRLRQHQLVPVGVQNGTEEQNRGAVNAGLSVFPMWRESQSVPLPGEATAKAAAGAKPAEAQEAAGTAGDKTPGKPPGKKEPPKGNKVVIQPIRSGRQIYAQGGDLVVLNTVSAGAELLADGNLHVYGALRGRALAGVSGDTSARIFCRSLNAELVSIAGHWIVRDDIDEDLIGREVQIYLKDGDLAIEPLI
ncbi:MAG: septum site-determining protein MinC [Rhodospirillales bacterium]|nr:septum site-determining protein MinC [Rhodospirillales bacterium]